jgi:hypothetical protein
MNKESLNAPDQFLIESQFLSDFITSFPYPANLKDVSTGQYLFENQASAEISDAEAIDDDDLDAQVTLQKRPTEDKSRVLLAKNGFVKIFNVVKIPLFNQHNQATAILTYSHDITKKIDLLSLFAFYKQFYTDARVAIPHFLRYLKVEHYFSESLTETELMVLIAMKYNSAHKSVARKLGIQRKTVEIHAGNLRNKLKDGCLYKLLALLRHEPASST